MIKYIIETVLWQIAFLLLYRILIKKETFFRLNRFFLLGSLGLSFVLPFVSFHRYQKVTDSVYQSLEPVILQSQNLQEQWIAKGNNSAILLLILSVAGIILILSIYNLYKIFLLYKKGEKKPYQNVVLIEIINLNNAFSFFNYIFIDKELPDSIKRKIIAHEMVHVKERHSLDILYLQFLKILFWYNPIIYMYEKEIKEIHEYIADKKVIQSFDKKEYLNLLLQSRFQNYSISFVNSFSNKTNILKKRIKMQNKKQSSKISYLKYSSLILVIFGLSIIINACKRDQENTINSLEKKNDTKQVQIDIMDSNDEIEVAFQFLKNPPQTKACEGLTGKEAKECFSKSIRDFVSKNFNINLLKELNTNRKKIKILTQFTIDKKGNVTNVRARSRYKILENEAIKTILSLPKMKPAIQDGHVVNTTYTLPIIVAIEE